MPEIILEPEARSDEPFAAVPGTLYLVGTPIGNLGDLSPRAASVLAAVDLIAAEDTRRTLRLLNYLGLRKHLESYHEHNWQSKGPQLLRELQSGRSIALVSDAGMPCISDPGAELAKLCVENSLMLTIVPGPCAAIVGLAGSGLSTDRFVFEGFLPATGKMRKTRLNQILTEGRTVVLYEAPHRLRRTLADLAALGLKERLLTLARELTKRHEEFLRLTIGEAAARYETQEPRGEYVLILEGLEAFERRCPSAGQLLSGTSGEETADISRTVLLDLLQQGSTIKDAVRQCMEKTGRKKNEIYQMALALQQENEQKKSPSDAKPASKSGCSQDASDSKSSG